MTSPAPDQEDEIYPWPDVEGARNDRRLQRRHIKRRAKEKYLASARSCPKCEASPEEQNWFYFESPEWTWENLCGRAGWMTFCDRCHVQVNFFLEIVS